MHTSIRIDDRMVGHDQPTLVVAEVSQTHDGSLGQAHAFIDAVARAGADAIKFQTHIASAESTPAEPWRVKFSRQDATRYDYWVRMEFSPEQWHGLAQHSQEEGLLFLSSAFSIEAVDLLATIGMPAWKIASGEVSNRPLLDYILLTGKPILLSSGMSPWQELDETVAWLKEREAAFAVFQCTTSYPCPPETVGLNILTELRERYNCPVGLSDHSGTIYPGLAAVALGADLLEVHVALSREMFGPDVTSSVTTGELQQLVEGVRFIETMRANPVDKDLIAAEMAPMRDLFSKSVVARVDLPGGTRLKAEHLTVKKPGTGIPANRLPELVGRRLRCDVAGDQLLKEEMLEASE
jgi:N,N'-diacetyllegionaminate synthase